MSLTEMVLMPGADYQEICEAVREKTGSTDRIKSGDLPSQIKGIESHGLEDAFLTDDVIGITYENDRITTVRPYAFYCMGGPNTIWLPNVTQLGIGAFRDSNVERIYLPKLRSMSTNVFNHAMILIFADLGVVKTLPSNTFVNAGKLYEVVLRKADGIATLANTNVFLGTSFAENGLGGKIYVPKALIEEYKKATNWSELYEYGNCEFVALEGSKYE